MKGLVIEFRHRVMASGGHDVFLYRAVGAVQVPAVGELVNINGHPWRVIDRAWSFYDEDTVDYCYVDVLPASPLTDDAVFEARAATTEGEG